MRCRLPLLVCASPPQNTLAAPPFAVTHAFSVLVRPRAAAHIASRDLPQATAGLSHLPVYHADVGGQPRQRVTYALRRAAFTRVACAMQVATTTAEKRAELRQAVRDLQERGLFHSAKWAAEHAVAVRRVPRILRSIQLALSGHATPDPRPSWRVQRRLRHSWPQSLWTTCTRSPRRSST